MSNIDKYFKRGLLLPPALPRALRTQASLRREVILAALFLFFTVICSSNAFALGLGNAVVKTSDDGFVIRIPITNFTHDGYSSLSGQIAGFHRFVDSLDYGIFIGIDGTYFVAKSTNRLSEQFELLVTIKYRGESQTSKYHIGQDAPIVTENKDLENDVEQEYKKEMIPFDAGKNKQSIYGGGQFAIPSDAQLSKYEKIAVPSLALPEPVVVATTTEKELLGSTTGGEFELDDSQFDIVGELPELKHVDIKLPVQPKVILNDKESDVTKSIGKTTGGKLKIDNPEFDRPGVLPEQNYYAINTPRQGNNLVLEQESGNEKISSAVTRKRLAETGNRPTWSPPRRELKSEMQSMLFKHSSE